MNTNQAVLGDTYSLTPTTFLDLRLSYSRFHYDRTALTKGFDLTQAPLIGLGQGAQLVTHSIRKPLQRHVLRLARSLRLRRLRAAGRLQRCSHCRLHGRELGAEAGYLLVLRLRHRGLLLQNALLNRSLLLQRAFLQHALLVQQALLKRTQARVQRRSQLQTRALRAAPQLVA